MVHGARRIALVTLAVLVIPAGVARAGRSHFAWLYGSEIVPERPVLYRAPHPLVLNTFAYEGLWTVKQQRIVSGGLARLRLHFLAQDVYLVLSGAGRLEVLVDGKHVKTIRVGGLSRLYTLVRFPELREAELELRFTPGISAYAFTFG